MTEKTKKELKKLYKKSLEKWKRIETIYLEEPEEARGLYFDCCAFCLSEKDSTVNPIVYNCPIKCGINRSICGGEESLLQELDELDGSDDHSQTIHKIVKALEKEIEKLN